MMALAVEPVTGRVECEVAQEKKNRGFARPHISRSAALRALVTAKGPLLCNVT